MEESHKQAARPPGRRHKVRILIVDDHPLFRAGVRALLQQQADFHVVGEADSVASAVRSAQELQPDVVLMDLSLPDGAGAEAARQVLAVQPHTYVIALTIHDESEMLIALAQAGAHGYILKGTRPADLVRAIQRVLNNGAAFSPEVLPGLLQQYQRLARTSDAGRALSPREQEILLLVAAGANNKEIAIRLGLSLQTIKNNLSTIYEKLHVSNRTEAVVVALEQDLLNRLHDQA